MPITLSKMAAKTATVTFSVGEDSVNIVYLPGKINDHVISQLDGNIEACTQALSEIIKSWDVMDDSVEPAVMFPLDASRLSELDYPFRLQVRQAIIQDMRPNSMTTQN